MDAGNWGMNRTLSRTKQSGPELPTPQLPVEKRALTPRKLSCANRVHNSFGSFGGTSYSLLYDMVTVWDPDLCKHICEPFEV